MFRHAFPLLLLALTGCIFDGRCTYETRTLVLAGRLTDRAAPPAPGPHTIEISLNETQGASPDFRVFNAYARTPLYIEVERVELAEVIQGDTTVLATWTNGNTTQPGVWSVNQDLLTSQPSHLQLAWRARAGALVAMVSLFGESRRLTGQLEIQEDGGWERPYCS
jgi:hypothetical protein